MKEQVKNLTSKIDSQRLQPNPINQFMEEFKED